MNTNPAIKPMPLWVSLLCFGIPSAIVWLSVYALMPALTKLGVPVFWNFWICLAGPMIGMFFAAFVSYRMEGRRLTWIGIKDRFRLRPVCGKEWCGVLALLASIGPYLFLRQTLSSWLASQPGFKIPSYIPSILDPRLSQTSIPTEYLGLPLRGSWWVLLIIFIVLFFNIFGEEFWWRGYILPRQELTHGKWTWLIHGILWAAFHSFWKWDVLSLLPGILLLSYVSCRHKNTTPAIIFHWVNNGLTLIATLLGILGVSL